jgi:hypothetical protein
MPVPYLPVSSVQLELKGVSKQGFRIKLLCVAKLDFWTKWLNQMAFCRFIFWYLNHVA